MAHKGKKNKKITASKPKSTEKKKTVQYSGLRTYIGKNMIPILLFAFVSILLYYKTSGFEYVLDDVLVYTKNRFVTKGLDGIPDLLSKESFTGYFGEQRDLVIGGRYRPLSLISFAVEYEFFGLNSALSHSINILLYLLTLWLFYRFVQLLLLEKQKTPFYSSIAFWSTLLFAVHPTHVEVVANVKGRDEIMVALFLLWSLILFIKHTDTKKLRHLFLSLLLSFLALLSKENAVVILGLAPLTIFFFRNIPFGKSLRKSLLFIVPVLSFLLIRYFVVGYFLSSGKQITDLMNNPFVGMTQAERYATIFYTLGLYLKLLFVPYPLTHDYYPYHIPIMNWGNWKTISSFIAYVGLLVYALRSFKKREPSSYFILFYLGSLFIVSNLLFSVGTFMNERFIFLSSIAFCIWLVWFAKKIIQQYRAEWAAKAIWGVAPLVLVYFLISWNRVPAWKDGFSLNSAAIKVSKNSARANSFMGTAWFKKYQAADRPDEQHVYLDQAEKYVNRAVEIVPSYKTAQKMKAGIAAENFKLDADLNKLLNTFKEVIMQHPGNAFVNEYLDYLNQRRTGYRELESFYLDVSYNKLYIQKNDLKWAIHYLNLGLSVNPNHPQMNYALGLLLQKIGDRTKGASYLQKARRLKPSIDQDFK